MLKELLEEILLAESASVSDINSALDNHHRILINYVSKTKEVADGPRIIEVYAYGLTKAGNPVIRAFQPFGDTASNVPDWKFFRLDGITYWEDKNQVFTTPASDRYPGVGKFNPNDDKTMSLVYKIAKFDGSNIPGVDDNDKDNLFRTSTETGIERLKQQLDNPITINDIDKNRQTPVQEPKPEPENDVYRTPTERGMDNLSRQLDNARKIDLSKFEKPSKQNDTPQDNTSDDEKARQKINNIIGTIKKSDLEKTLNSDEEPEPESDVYKTPTERGMADLSKKLDNAQKIDLSKFGDTRRRRW